MSKLVLDGFQPLKIRKEYQHPIPPGGPAGFQLDRGVVILCCNNSEDSAEYAVLLRDYIWHKTKEVWSVQHDEERGWNWKPTVHIITDAREKKGPAPPGAYPELTPCNGYDQHDHTAARKLHPLGVFLRLEERALPFRKNSLPTWRRWQPNHPLRRPQVIICNPDDRALEILENSWPQLKNYLKIPSLSVTATRPLTRNAHHWLDRAITPNPQAAAFFRERGVPAWVPNLAWAPEVRRRAASRAGRPFRVVYAHTWGDTGRKRLQPTEDWPEGERPTQGLRSALTADAYVILARQETFPWDAYLAAAHGATVIAPNIGVYRGVPQATLFPTFQTSFSRTEATWDHTATREWLRYTLRKLQRKRKCPRPRNPPTCPPEGTTSTWSPSPG